MAIGGSFSQDAFTPKDPWRTWAEVQGLGLYWDTDNQFAAGKQGVKMIDTPGVSQGRTPRYDLGVGAPVGSIQRARATPVNMFGSARPISAGGRNYGDQTINRDELARLSSMGTTVASAITPVAERVGQSWSGVRARRRAARETEQQARETEQQGRAMMAQGVPPAPGAGGPSPLPPPAPGAGRPGGLPAPQAPLAPQKNPLATSNWRKVQAQRIAEQAMGQPGQPAPDVTLGSRMYQEEIARRRAQRTPGAPIGFPPPPGSAMPSPMAPPPPGAKRPAPIGFPAPVVASPVTPVGDQTARLSAEGAMPVTPGEDMGTETEEARGAKSLTRPLTKSLTKPLTNRPSGSGGAGGTTARIEGTTSKNPRRKR